jgi:hypothetical protein
MERMNLDQAVRFWAGKQPPVIPVGSGARVSGSLRRHRACQRRALQCEPAPVLPCLCAASHARSVDRDLSDRASGAGRWRRRSHDHHETTGCEFRREVSSLEGTDFRPVALPLVPAGQGAFLRGPRITPDCAAPRTALCDVGCQPFADGEQLLFIHDATVVPPGPKCRVIQPYSRSFPVSWNSNRSHAAAVLRK